MRFPTGEIVRFGTNGLVATAVHYFILTFNLTVLSFESAGLANFIAAIFGITTSFFGNRYFVFKKTTESLTYQATKFSGLYGAIAVLHGLFLWLWTDLNSLDYRLGFLVATAVQVTMSYIGNKFIVFKS